MDGFDILIKLPKHRSRSIVLRIIFADKNILINSVEIIENKNRFLNQS